MHILGSISSSCKLRYLWIMRDFAYSYITDRRPLCRDGNNTETVLFAMLLAFVLYGHKVEEYDGLQRTRRIDAHSG